MSVNLNALKQYKSVDLRAAVETATPHQLILMLFNGALDALAKSTGAIERNDITERTHFINKASDIVVNLRSMLNLEEGGELAANLESLYEYMIRKLMEANRDNSTELVEEVAGLLAEVRDGWAEIPPKERL